MGHPHGQGPVGQDGWNYSQPPAGQSPTPNRGKRAAIVFAVAAVLLLALGIGGYLYTESEDEGFAPTREPNTASERSDWLEYEMDRETDAQFLQRPLAERLSYGQERYNRQSQMYYDTINTTVGKYSGDKQLRVLTGGVPLLTRDSSAQEIMDFQSIANAMRTGQDDGYKVGSFYLDDGNAAAIERIADYDIAEPESTAINTYQVVSDSGLYVSAGSTYVDIRYINAYNSEDPVDGTYKQEVFTSVLDDKEYVTYRAMGN